MTDEITMTGNYPVVPRFRTGIYSLDYALGNIIRSDLGPPLSTYYLIYGDTHRGKSTISYFLSSCVPGNVINICDIEGCDREYVKVCAKSAKYVGELAFVEATDKKDKPITHAQMLTSMINRVGGEDNVNAGIFDSVGAYISVAEMNNDIDDSNMGVRAKQMSNAGRKMVAQLAGKAKAIFVVNHVQGVIGGRGHIIPGGVALQALAGVHINIWHKEYITTGSEDEKETIGYVIGGTVEKLRYGGKGRKFQVVNIPGYGVNRDMSAVFDCFAYGLASRDTTVKMGEKSYGYLKNLFTAAIHRDKDKFQDFHEALRQKEQRDMFEGVRDV
jgi:RecA/RadA recombinase